MLRAAIEIDSHLSVAASRPDAAGSNVNVCENQVPSVPNVCVWVAGFQEIVRLQLSVDAVTVGCVPAVQPKIRTSASPVEAGVSNGSRRPRLPNTVTVNTVPVGTLMAVAVCVSLYLRSAPVSPTRFRPVKYVPAAATSVAGLLARSAGSMDGFTAGERLTT